MHFGSISISCNSLVHLALHFTKTYWMEEKVSQKYNIAKIGASCILLNEKHLSFNSRPFTTPRHRHPTLTISHASSAPLLPLWQWTPSLWRLSTNSDPPPRQPISRTWQTIVNYSASQNHSNLNRNFGHLNNFVDKIIDLIGRFSSLLHPVH